MTEDLSIAEKGTVGRRVAVNTGMMVGAKALAALIGLMSLIIVTQTLAISDVGIILFLHAYMLFFADVATFQSWQAVIRYGANDVEVKNTSRLISLLRFCVLLDFIGAVFAYILAVIGLLFLGQILSHLPSFQGADAVSNIDLITKLGIPYCLLILVHQGGASMGVFRLFDKFKPLALQILVMPVFRLIGVVAALLSGGDIYAFLGAWFVGSLAGYLTLPLMAMFELKSRELWRPLINAWPRLNIKRPGLWSFVWKANVDASLATGTTHLPLLLVMPIFGPAYVGVYKVAEEIAKLLSEGVLLLDRVIYPEYARLMIRGDREKMWKIVTKTAALMLAGGFVVAAFVAIFGPILIPKIFGHEYLDAVPLAILLVFAAALMGGAAPLYPVFFAAGEPGKAIVAKGFGLATYIILVFVLSAQIGKTGPGWAAIFGNLAAVMLAALLARKILIKQAQYGQN